jgi:hypothetical protein
MDSNPGIGGSRDEDVVCRPPRRVRASRPPRQSAKRRPRLTGRFDAASQVGLLVLTTLRREDAWGVESMSESRPLGCEAYQIVSRKKARSSSSHPETIGYRCAPVTVRSVAGLQIERVRSRRTEIGRRFERARPSEKVRGSNPLSSTTPKPRPTSGNATAGAGFSLCHSAFLSECASPAPPSAFRRSKPARSAEEPRWCR